MVEQVRLELMPGAQSEFVASQALYPGYFAGRRGGKTVASVAKMVAYIQQNPGAVGCVTMPTLDDRDRIFVPTMERFFGSGKGQWWDYGKRDGLLVFGDVKREDIVGKVFLRTTDDPDRLRGMTLAFAAMDEVGTGNQWDAFKILQPAVSLEGYPPQMWATSTPKVDAAWVKLLWKDKKWPETKEDLDPDDIMDYPIFHARTEDNFHLAPHVRIKLVKQWGQTRNARQELHGEFLSPKGVRFSDILVPEIHQRQPRADQQWRMTGIAGLDMGGVSPTALVELRQDMSGRLWAVDEFYQPGAIEGDWVLWLRDKGIKKVICDPTASREQLLRWRHKLGINIQAAPMTGGDSIRGWLARLHWWQDALTLKCPSHIEPCGCPQERRLPDIFISPYATNLWSELMTLEPHIPRGSEDPEDRWRPHSMDHAYDACAYGGSFFGKVIGRPALGLNITRAA